MTTITTLPATLPSNRDKIDRFLDWAETNDVTRYGISSTNPERLSLDIHAVEGQHLEVLVAAVPWTQGPWDASPEFMHGSAFGAHWVAVFGWGAK